MKVQLPVSDAIPWSEMASKLTTALRLRLLPHPLLASAARLAGVVRGYLQACTCMMEQYSADEACVPSSAQVLGSQVLGS
jgi:hypothetical protein